MAVNFRGIKFERLGHASIRLTTEDGRVIYIDPWDTVLGDRSPNDADVVFVSHDDPDHYDPPAIEKVANEDTIVAAYEGVDTSDLEFDVVSLAYDDTTTVDGIQVRTVPAHNRSDGPHTDDEGNPFHAEREVVGLLLTLDDTVVYFTSDTDFLSEHEDITADVFIPPIGGHYTMDRQEAAEFAESVGAELVLPVHYDTFEAIETDASAFKRNVEAQGITVELF